MSATTTSDPTLGALLAGILAEPADDNIRLIYADCLEENGQGDRAEFVRVQVAATQLVAEVSHGAIPCVSFSQHGTSGSREVRFKARVVQGVPLDSLSGKLPMPVSLVLVGGPAPYLVRFDDLKVQAIGYHSDGAELSGRVTLDGKDWRTNYPRYTDLRRREREIAKGNRLRWLSRVLMDMESESASPVCEYHRGFVAHVTCDASSWLAHADAITAAHPIERVTLTTSLPVIEHSGTACRLAGRTKWHPPVRSRTEATSLRIVNRDFPLTGGTASQFLTGRELLEVEWPGVTFDLPPGV